MEKIYIMWLLVLIPLTMLGNDINLGEPVNVELIREFYGEEEISEQEGSYSNIYANYEERYILYDMNLYRLAPQILINEDVNPDPDVKKCVNWGYCFQPVKPLYWNLDLSRAARYHSDDMIKNECFSHDDCDGGNIWERIKDFYTSGNKVGENIAAGSAYNNVTRNFINEKGAELGTVGHRENVFDKEFNELGLGYLKGGVYNMYTTQDFGSAAIPHVIPAAIHEPQFPDLGTVVKFKAIYHGSSENVKGWLILNSKIYPMNKSVTSNDWKKEDYIGDLAFEERNWYSAEYLLESIIDEACSKYSFLFIVDGESYRYPDKGSLIAGKTCNHIYDATEVTIDETSFEDVKCEENSCTEENKTICNVSYYKLSCSCDEGYKLDPDGVCVEDISPTVYRTDDGCNYGSNKGGFLFFMLLIMVFISRKVFT